MKNIHGEVVRIPKGLRKNGDLNEALNTNPSKRSGRMKKVRHKIKELCKKLINN